MREGGGPEDVAGSDRVDNLHLRRIDTHSQLGRGTEGTGVNQSFIWAPFPIAVAVDSVHIYWANFGSTGWIGRANLDGTGVNQSFITGANNSAGVAVDASHVYWSNQGAGTIGRANVDGTGVCQNFISGATNPEGVEVGSG
jgi:hypothetical protein